MKKMIVEFIGTFFLVFAIGCTVGSGSAIAALAFGSTLMVMVYAGGHISGAHYNPAVSLAIYIRGSMTALQMIQYWVVQIFGGIFGGIMSYVVTGYNQVAITHAPGADVTVMNALLAEVFGTFALCYVVLNVATAKANAGNSFYGMAIGFTVFAMAVGLGPISGGAFNPAVGVGRNITETLMNGTSTLTHMWLYVVGPLIGAFLAALAFKTVITEDEAVDRK